MARDPDAKLDTPTFFKHDIERIAKESVAPIVADLVDKAIDDGRINIDDNVQRIIQADKDILSQIVYDEENDNIIFPKGIVPLKAYFEGRGQYIYFNYSTIEILNDTGNAFTVDEIYIIKEDGKIGIHDDLGAAEISEIVYLNVSDIDELAATLDFNTYNLFHAPSAGTKLYKHNISIQTDTTESYSFTIISTRQTQYSGLDSMLGFDLIAISPEGDSDSWGLASGVYASVGNKLTVYGSPDFTSTGNITTFTDTVTEL